MLNFWEMPVLCCFVFRCFQVFQSWKGWTQSWLNCTCKTASSSKRMRGFGRKPSFLTRKIRHFYLSWNRSFPSPKTRTPVPFLTPISTLAPVPPPMLAAPGRSPDPFHIVSIFGILTLSRLGCVCLFGIGEPFVLKQRNLCSGISFSYKAVVSFLSRVLASSSNMALF